MFLPSIILSRLIPQLSTVCSSIIVMNGRAGASLKDPGRIVLDKTMASTFTDVSSTFGGSATCSSVSGILGSPGRLLFVRP